MGRTQPLFCGLWGDRPQLRCHSPSSKAPQGRHAVSPCGSRGPWAVSSRGLNTSCLLTGHSWAPTFPFRPCSSLCGGQAWGGGDESSGNRTSLGFLVPVSEESLVGWEQARREAAPGCSSAFSSATVCAPGTVRRQRLDSCIPCGSRGGHCSSTLELCGLRCLLRAACGSAIRSQSRAMPSALRAPPPGRAEVSIGLDLVCPARSRPLGPWQGPAD